MLRRTIWLSAIVLSTAALEAQSVDTASTRPAAAATPVVRRTIATLNPFALFATYFTGDVEHLVNPSVTFGVGGSFAHFNDNTDYSDYGALEAKLRYYPSEKAPQGFAIAGTFGFATSRVTNIYVFTAQPVGTSIDTPAASTRETRATLGTELSYQWLLGPSRRFVTVVGLGVKRVLGTTDNYSDPLSLTVIPTARINIGIAF
jgi:hypothetical protein